MNLVTLTTDFGHTDSYVGTMKGVILGRAPGAQIIDLCHSIPPHDIRRAAYLIKASFKYFPEGTIHLIVVDPGVGGKRRIILIKARGHLFLAPDNGVLTPFLTGAAVDKAWLAERPDLYLQPVSHTFHGRDIFAPIAAWLAQGGSADSIGPGINPEELTTIEPPGLKIDPAQNQIHGSVIDIDHFGNIITNISRQAVDHLTSDLTRTELSIGGHSIKSIRTSYDQVPAGRLLLIFNSNDLLEIAANRSSAQKIIVPDLYDHLSLIIF